MSEFIHVTSEFDWEQYANLKALAKAQGRVVSQLLNESIAAFLAQEQELPPEESPQLQGRKQRHKPILNSKALWVFMRQKGLTDGQFAEMLGISREYLNRILHHRYTPSPQMGLKLMETTGLGYFDLFPDSPDALVEEK